MSKMEFLGPFKAEKFKKQKWVQFCRTPCIMQMHILIIYNEVLLDVKQLALCSNITSADWGGGSAHADTADAGGGIKTLENMLG